MTESQQIQLESLCADITYMFVLNRQNEIVYVVNDTEVTDSTTEEEYRQAMDSFVARNYQFKTLYDLLQDHYQEPSQNPKACMKCLEDPNPTIIHNMCIHEYIKFLELCFHERNIISF